MTERTENTGADMYQIKVYHSGDNKQNQGERLLEVVENRWDAERVIKQVASSWYNLTSGRVVAKLGRIEFRADGWGCAVYVEKV